ncbi:hypothetical protein HYX05_04395 [Candidatus Woesearchaeota archaeon]|nr:hypothetical protein [Candidatus Woesearchaeota archaeon]
MAPLIYLAFTKSIKKVAIVSIIYGAFASIISFTWVYDINLEYRTKLYLLIILIFTIYFVLFLTIIAFFSKKLKSNYIFLLPPLIWLLLMLLYSLLPIQIYWMDLAIFQPLMAPLIWYIGSYGVTFLIILFNSVLAYYFVKRNKNLLFLLLFLTFMLAFSALYSNYSDFSHKEGKIKVALLQGNFPFSWEWRQQNSFDVIYSTYIDMTYEASKQQPDIIVWPEYSLADDITKNKKILAGIKSTAQYLNTTLIVGAISYVDEENFTDTAFVFKPDGTFETYDSVEPIFMETSVAKGKRNEPLSYNKNKFGITLCNEENMQSITKNYAVKDAQFIISMSNNQFFGRGRHIISQFTKLRAAENAKYLARATNDGITQIINPFGKVVYSLEPKKQNILIGDIYINSYKTFYTKYGNVLVYLLMILSVFLILKKR